MYKKSQFIMIKTENNLGRAAGSNLIMKDNILTDSGLQHLQEWIRSGAIRSQCTEMDITFIRQFVDIYMQKDEFGLAKLQCLIQEQSKENAENSSPKSNEDRLLNQNFLLSFYICLLIRIIQSSGPVILLDRPQICEFIRQFQCQLFNRYSTQFSSNLCQLSYDFLLELHKMEFPIKYWPFQIDLQKLIIFPLEDESTPIYLRQSIEKLAIAQLNVAQGPSNENVAANFAGKMELIIPLAEVLLAADFSLVFESCSRIFCSCENIGQLLYTLPEERLYQRIIQKAKSRTQKIGNSFAELVAKLISFQFQNDYFDFDTVTNCFQNQFNHSLVLAKIVENLPKIEGKDEEFKRKNKMILELLATGSNFNLNLIGPLLPKYREIYSENDFVNFLMNFFNQNNIWRNSYSADGLKAILDALIDIDPELDGILLETVQSILIPDLLINRSALIILERISQKIGGEKLLKKRPKLLKPLSDFLKPILIDEIDDCPANCSIADIIMDSALHILNNFCGQQHGLDPNALFDRLLAISLDREFNESLRQLALQYLTKYNANKLAGNWAKLFQVIIDNDEIKNLILTNAFGQLEESMKITGNLPDNEFIGCISELMNLLEPEEEESPSVLMEASKICEAIVNEIGGFGGAEIEMFASKWAKFKSQMEMIERRKRDRDRDDLDLRTKMEEMIITLGQNCNIDCSEKCGSKDCY